MTRGNPSLGRASVHGRGRGPLALVDRVLSGLRRHWRGPVIEDKDRYGRQLLILCAREDESKTGRQP